MLKKMFAAALAVCMVFTMAMTVSANQPGVIISPPDTFGGAYIDVEEAGFEIGKTYTVYFTVNGYGNGGFRARWTSGNGTSEGGPIAHNDEDPASHSTAAATANGFHATQIPAQWPRETVPFLEDTTISVTFTYGEVVEPALNPTTMRFIGLFGMGGEANYEVKAVWYEEVAGAPAPAEQPEAVTGSAPAPADNAKGTQPSPATSANNVLYLALFGGLAAFGALVVLRKKARI